MFDFEAVFAYPIVVAIHILLVWAGGMLIDTVFRWIF